MTWKKTGMLAIDALAFTTHITRDICVFRTTRSLLGWREGTAGPLWEVLLAGDTTFGTKQSVLIGGVVATVVVPSRAPGVLLAVDPWAEDRLLATGLEGIECFAWS